MAIPTSNHSMKVSSQSLAILALDMATHTAVGAATAATVVALNPLIGAAFGAIYFAGSHTVNLLTQSLEKRVNRDFGNQTASFNTMKFALTFFSGIALATTACTSIGIPIVFSTGVILAGAMLTTTIAVATFVFNPTSKDVVIRPSLF